MLICAPMTSPSQEATVVTMYRFGFLAMLVLQLMLNCPRIQSNIFNVYQNKPHLHFYLFISRFLSLRTTSTPTTPSPHSTRRMTVVHRHPRCCQREPVRCRAAAQTQSVSAINAAATMDASTPAWSLSSRHQVSSTKGQTHSSVWVLRLHSRESQIGP